MIDLHIFEVLERTSRIIALAAHGFISAKLFKSIDLVAVCHGFETLGCSIEEVRVPLIIFEAAKGGLVWFEVMCGRWLAIADVRRYLCGKVITYLGSDLSLL